MNFLFVLFYFLLSLYTCYIVYYGHYVLSYVLFLVIIKCVLMKLGFNESDVTPLTKTIILMSFVAYLVVSIILEFEAIVTIVEYNFSLI